MKKRLRLLLDESEPSKIRWRLADFYDAAFTPRCPRRPDSRTPSRLGGRRSWSPSPSRSPTRTEGFKRIIKQAKRVGCGYCRRHEVELSKEPRHNQEAFVSRANAQLIPRARLRLSVLVVDQGWTCTAAAKMFMVSPRTAAKWANWYRDEGPDGMADRSSHPHHSPTKTPQPVLKQIVALRWRHRLGPVQIAGRLGVSASTVHAVLTRCRINRLSHIDRVTGEPLRPCEHDHPGSLIHVDVTKFGNIPDGGGWRYLGKAQGNKNKAATALRTGRTASGHPRIGTCFVHTVIDDHSRVAYAEICPDEKAVTAIGVLQRATAWFADHDVTVERVLSDNGSAYRSHAWRDACAELDITHKRTRPYRPQTNGKN